MWLHDCSPEEKHTLIAMATLAATLPAPLLEYMEALGEVTREYFNKSGTRQVGSRNPMPGSLSLTHTIAASPRYGTK